MNTNPTHKLHIIAIGASAGGLEALQKFLSHLPELKNTCVIVAQHLSPTHKSMLVQLLSKKTKLSVAEAENNKTLESNKVYITPPGKEIAVKNNKIILQKPGSAIGPKPSVDVLFKSLAQNKNSNVIAIVLSGTGSDGAAGITALKEVECYIIVQEPETAKYDGMPISAINTGMTDAVLPPEKMGEEIHRYLNTDMRKKIKKDSIEKETSAIDKILYLLGKYSDADFSNYKSATIGRRLEKRMNALGVQSIKEYLNLIEKKPGEADEMFKTILIGVTTFFRDKEAFKALETYLKKIIKNKGKQEPIRIWVPGCSTGEEPYSIAILLSKILKDKIQDYKIQIFATDIDERAISKARKGIYPEASLENLSKSIREKYFIKKNNEFELIKAIRGMVLFSRHDVIKNPPFLKIDLISCRNLLIYFNTALQKQIIPVFHYSLNPESYLFLGKSETVGQFNNLFSSVDTKNKIFKRKSGRSFHKIKLSNYKAQKQEIYPDKKTVKEENQLSLQEKVKETLFNTYEHPYVVVDENHDIQEVNGDVRLFLTLSPGSIQVNLIKMANPELQIELRSVLSKAIKERNIIKSNIKRFKLFDALHFVRITAQPLIYTESTENYFIVIFEKLDIERYVSTGKAENTEGLVNMRIQELEDELGTTKEHLQTYIEEIETSNEELQSLNEELQSTNEEMQSTNEELETSNEELQSANEEIQITYTELRVANEELQHKDKLLQQIQANTQALLNNDLQAFILVDPSYNILKFNTKALETFKHLKSREIVEGESIIDLFPSGQIETFVQDFNKAVAGKKFQDEKEFTNSKGQKCWYSVSYTPVSYSDGSVAGISIGLLDISDLKIALSKLIETELLVNTVFNAVTVGICIIDENGVFEDVNDEYCKIYGYKKAELIGEKFTKIVLTGQKKKMLEEYQTSIKNETFTNYGKEISGEYEVLGKNGKTIDVAVVTRLIHRADGRKFTITSIRDITKQKQAQRELDQVLHSLKERNKEQNCLYKITSLGNYNYDIDELLGKAVKLLPDGFQYPDITSAQIHYDGKIYKSDNHRKSKWITKSAKKSTDGKELSIEVFYRQKTAVKEKESFLKEEIQMVDSVANNLVMCIDQIISRQKIKFSEQRFRSLVQDGSDLISVLDKKNLFKYVSPSHKNYIGYTHSELMGKNPFDFIHPDDLRKTKDEFKLLQKENRVKSSPHRFKHKNGGWRWVQTIATNMIDDYAVKGIVLNSVDITEIFETQEKLKESESRYRGFYESQTNYVIRTDMEGNYSYFNKKFEEDFGWLYPDGKILGKNSLTSICEHDHLKVFETVEQCVKEPEKVFKIEIDKPSKNGGVVTTLWDFICILDGKGNPNEIQCIGIDITERIEAEKELKASNNRFEKVAQATRDAIWDYNIVDDTIYWGSGYTDLFGYKIYKKKQPIDNWSKKIHKADYKKIADSLDKALKNPNCEKWEAEYRYKKADNSYTYVSDRGIIIRNEKNRAIRMVGAVTDISAQKEFEASLKQLNESLQKQTLALSQSNYELEQFAYVASHDLQEPLRMITNFLTQLEKKYSDKLDEKGNKYIHFAVDGAVRMRQIILDLLEFSRVGKHEDNLEKIQLGEMIKNITALHDKAIEESGAEIQFKKLHSVKSFRSPLRQVLHNLINNALKYRKKNIAAKIKISSEEFKDHWKIAVKDNGIGIEKNNLDKIFVIFKRLHDKTEYSGTGLGLAIVKKTIENLGGKIWVKSTPGKGSTFYFTIKKPKK